MSLSSSILRLVNALFGRQDLPSRGGAQEPGLAGAAPAVRRIEPRGAAVRPEPALSSEEHLGAWAPLIDAIRDELLHFAASHVRLHLAIAERDRFLLTSIGVGCDGDDAARQLLRRFGHEFKPEQVKRYLAREVIGALPNAAAFDLSQFVGLVDADARDAAHEAAEAGDYAELLAALRTPAAAPKAAPVYVIHLLGRWVEADAPAAAARGSSAEATPSTPLAGQRREFDVEDAAGRRRVVLQGVVPGRRYVVGSGEGCDIRVDGAFTSRRHAELWLDADGWHVADLGSTNGVRVETPGGEPRHGGDEASARRPQRLGAGQRLVLSARAEGSPADHPWLALRADTRDARPSPFTPIAPLPGSLRTPRTEVMAVPPVAATLATPATEVLPARPATHRIVIAQGAGRREVELEASRLPFSIGRSRNQALVIDRAHDAVSGHHVDIVAFADGAAEIVVQGDNGVRIDGVAHRAGERLSWPLGATLTLGAAADDPASCTLLLLRVVAAASTERGAS